MAEDGEPHYITATELAVPSSAHEVRYKILDREIICTSAVFSRYKPPESCCALADLPPKGHTTIWQDEAIQRINNFPGRKSHHISNTAYL